MNRGTQKLAQGFTLVEVLVSGFILFLVLAAMTDLYRGAILGSSKAEQSLKISSAVSFVRANLSASLRANPPLQEGKGNGKFGEVYYRCVLLWPDPPVAHLLLCRRIWPEKYATLYGELSLSSNIWDRYAASISVR